MLTQEQVLAKLRDWMQDLFEIEPDDIQLDSNLYEDLDVDSIDAVDLVVKIKELTGSEDKQLGNRFVNPKDGNITFDQFRSKVLFYLWSEVYKDEFGTQSSIFKYELEENNPIDFQFGELYNNNAIDIVITFLKFNGLEPEQ